MRDTRPNNADDLKPIESRWETPDPTILMTWTPENRDERHQTQQCRWPEPQRIYERHQTQQCNGLKPIETLWWETPDPTILMTWTPENLDERHQTQQCRWPEAQRIYMRDTRPNNADDLKPIESRWETPDPTMQMTWTPENLDERHQTQQCRWPEAQRIYMRDTRPNNADDLKPRESRWETPDPTMQMTWSP